MKVKLKKEELEYLKSTFFSDSVDDLGNTYIDLSENNIDEIRDWASERQQMIGFDKDYNLNDEGKLLESIIDKLHH